MDIEQFDYYLPDELIAQTPLKNRSQSKLLVLNKSTNSIVHDTFEHIKKYLRPGDCLVLNDSKVIPVRLYGNKTDTGAKIELLLLHEEENNIWEALVKPARKIKIGSTISFGNGKLIATCIGEKDAGARRLQLKYDGVLLEILDEIGEMPLPPYIKETLEDRDRYQTIYAKEKGSAAAPTAGLHFTNELLKSLTEYGIRIAYVTLHVGLGTFRPINVESILDHDMHAEYYYLTAENAKVLQEVKKSGHRIISVGTTSTRVLETVVNKYDGVIKPSSGWTNIFIYPPYTFRAINGLITNFHLPKSTLLLLVSALASKDLILSAYKEAIEKNYRFFSFGDAMFILAENGEKQSKD